MYLKRREIGLPLYQCSVTDMYNAKGGLRCQSNVQLDFLQILKHACLKNLLTQQRCKLTILMCASDMSGSEQTTPPPAPCGCGQQCTFNMTYGVTPEGNVVVTPLGLGGDVGVGVVTTTEISVDVGSREY